MASLLVKHTSTCSPNTLPELKLSTQEQTIRKIAILGVYVSYIIQTYEHFSDAF